MCNMYAWIVLEPILRFVKTSENAFTPTKGSDKAAGFDLYSSEKTIIPAKGWV